MYRLSHQELQAAKLFIKVNQMNCDRVVGFAVAEVAKCNLIWSAQFYFALREDILILRKAQVYTTIQDLILGVVQNSYNTSFMRTVL